MLDFLGIGSDQLIESLTETLQMLVTSAVIGAVIAMIIALILILTRTGGLMENRVIFAVLDTVTNIVRSIPFIILLVYIGPLTKMIVGTRIGTKAAIVPLVFYIVPMMVRLFENSFLDVDHGIIEAGTGYGGDEWTDYPLFSVSGIIGIDHSVSYNCYCRSSGSYSNGRSHRRRWYR